MTEERVAWHQWPGKWMKDLYNWVIHWSKTKYSLWALFILAFAESSFFPIPPDVLLIAMAFSEHKKAFFYATVCSVGSVLGGIFGYALGFYFWQVVGDFFLAHVFSQELFDIVTQKYQDHSFWIIFTAAFTPIPYKIFTITAGVMHVNLVGFIVASAVGRSMRFFLVGGIFYVFGDKARRFVEKYLEWLTLAFTVLLILGFVFIKKIL